MTTPSAITVHSLDEWMTSVHEHLAATGQCTWLSVDAARGIDELHLTAHYWVGVSPWCRCGQVRKP